MGARQTFLGALAFADAASLDAAIDEVLGPGVLGAVPQPLVDRVRAGRRGSVLFVSDDADAPSSQWHTLVGAYHELAARALRGRVSMLYRGGGSELSVAVAAGPDPRPAPPTPPTQRFLRLETNAVEAVHLSDGSPIEFDVVRRADGTAAIDGRDWLGFFGVLFERGETLHFEPERGGVFEWARPDRAGSWCLVALPTSTQLVLVEVLGARPLVVRGEALEAIELTLHRVEAFESEHDLVRPLHRRTAIWVAPERGIVAFG